ncbi:MAG: hypothetical protein WBK20_05735 [Spirochaetota bacterium]
MNIHIKHTIASIIVLYVVLYSFLVYAKPKAGFGIIRGYSSDENYLATLIRGHCVNIATSLGIFDVINPDNLLEQLQRLPCKEEQCILQFASHADLQIIVMGTVERSAQGYTIAINAYGPDMPYYGKQFCSYRTTVAVNILDKADREASYIAEEIASQFMARLCEQYTLPLTVKNNTVTGDYIVHGKYTYYTVQTVYENYTVLVPGGTVEVDKNKVLTAVTDGSVILINFKKEAESIKNFYYGRKKEIVFKKSTVEESCILMTFTVPASASMPLVVPLFGYYTSEDYRGLLLWAGNVVPYIGLEIWGFINRPAELKKQHNDISRNQMASYYFAWYMLLVGGMPSFVDAFSHQYLQQARYYQGQVPTMGSSTTEVYLALLGGGSGMFYKGNRLWGYVYFHLTNICVYGLLYNYAKPQSWDQQNNRYTLGSSHSKAMYAFAGLLSLIKIVEIVHTVSVPYALSVTDEISSVEVSPDLWINTNEKVIGISCAMHF